MGTWWQRHKEQLERFGLIAVLVGLSLFVIEMTVLVSLIRAGVDLRPFLDTVSGWIGVDASGILDAAGTFGIAYAITRLLKPFQIAATVVLTPPVAAIWWRIRPPADAASWDEGARR